jgi:hypothetical protein
MYNRQVAKQNKSKERNFEAFFSSVNFFESHSFDLKKSVQRIFREQRTAAIIGLEIHLWVRVVSINQKQTVSMGYSGEKT